MTTKDRQYFISKITALRNALDVLLVELGADNPPVPRKRRDLKQERVEFHETNIALGRWRKPRKKQKPQK